MREESRSAALCRRIIEHCHQRGWYGPDDALEHGMETERYVVDVDGMLRHLRIAHDPHTGFEFAPATTDQVLATELALGFALPPLLRAVYTQVANGGFGPGQGLTGMRGGYAYGQDRRYITLDRTEPPPWATHTLELGDLEGSNGSLRSYTLPPQTWPSHFLHLCYWGCETDSYLDAVSGRVYWVGGAGPHTVALMRQDKSLERWLETWLQGKWREWFPDADIEASSF